MPKYDKLILHDINIKLILLKPQFLFICADMYVVVLHDIRVDQVERGLAFEKHSLIIRPKVISSDIIMSSTQVVCNALNTENSLYSYVRIP